jgi:hypothetical protein
VKFVAGKRFLAASRRLPAGKASTFSRTGKNGFFLINQ